MKLKSITSRLRFVEYIRLGKIYWRTKKLYFCLLLLLSLSTSLVQISTIGFLAPILEFIQKNGAVNLDASYWKYISTAFGSISLPVSFVSLLIVFFCILCGFQILSYFRNVESQSLSQNAELHLKQKIIESMLFSKYQQTKTFSNSYLTSLLISDSAHAGSFFYLFSEYCFVMVQITAITCFLFFLSTPLTFCTLIFSGLILLATRLKVWNIHKSGALLSKISQKLAQSVYEQVNALKYIKVLGLEKQTQLPQLAHANKEVSIHVIKMTEKINSLISPIHFLSLVLILILSYQVLGMAFYKIVLYMVLLYRLEPLLKALNKISVRLEKIMPRLKKIQSFLSKVPVQKQTPQRILPYKDLDLSIKNLSFRYDNKQENVLDNVTFSFDREKIYALTGPSGQGKTTLIDIILGLFEIDAGALSYSKKAKPNLKPQMFYLTQDPHIIEGTVRDNLLFSKHNSPSDEDLNQALSNVNLLEEFQNKQGLDTLITESGKNLSGGQKQRLALARVFLFDYSLIILDEYTSSIDTYSKRVINQAIKNITYSLIILVSHDPETLQFADQVLELKDGKLFNFDKSVVQAIPKLTAK